MRLKPQTYALTTVAYQRRHVFQRDAIAELFIATIFRYRDAGKFQLHAFVVMPNHAHVVMTPAPYLAIEKCAQLIKGGFSFAVRKEFTGEIWQEGYHPHRVTDDDDLRNQILYIVNNPIKKGAVEYPHIHTAAAYVSRIDPMPKV
jgi:putative transposase